MRFFCIIALAAVIAHPALASLGNDDETIDSMYGDIVKRHLRDDGTVSVLYHNQKYYCFVVFKDLHTISEAYSRGDGRKLTDKEISALLQANAGRSRWPAKTLSTDGKMERADHKAEASFTEIEGRLMLQITSKAKS
jgi:hypothetical protein